MPDDFRPDDADPDPERSARRPFRVVGFDDLAAAEEERPVRVAAFGDLDEPAAPPPRVASLDLARARRRPSAAGEDDRVDGVDGVDGGDDRRGRGDRGEGRGRRSAGRRRGEGRPAGAGAESATPGDDPAPCAGAGVAGAAVDAGGAPSGGAAPAFDDGVPPDRPLPKGRRRGAGRARVGRLGPDAPGPDEKLPPADPVAVAREICLRLLTDRARTRQELTQALTRREVPADAIATVLDRFDEVGLIDDAAFAEQWVRSRHAHRGLGRRAIAVELRRKGVADEVAGEALAAVDAESEGRRARELVDRKLRSLVVDTPEQRAKAANRLVGMLARKGYGAGVAYRVVREALAEHGAEVDELGTEPGD